LVLAITLALPVCADEKHAVAEKVPEVPAHGMLDPSGLDENALIIGLYHGLRNLAGDFAEAERETGINAAWLAAIAALESGWGRSDLAMDKCNLFGWMGSDGYRSFDSPEACIMIVAKALRDDYLTPGGRCYNGQDIDGVAVCYCPNPEWAREVRRIYEGIVRRCAG